MNNPRLQPIAMAKVKKNMAHAMGELSAARNVFANRQILMDKEDNHEFEVLWSRIFKLSKKIERTYAGSKSNDSSNDYTATQNSCQVGR